MNYTNLLLTILKSEKSSSEAPGDTVFGEEPCPGSRLALSSVSSHDGRTEESLSNLFY